MITWGVCHQVRLRRAVGADGLQTDAAAGRADGPVEKEIIEPKRPIIVMCDHRRSAGADRGRKKLRSGCGWPSSGRGTNIGLQRNRAILQAFEQRRSQAR